MTNITLQRVFKGEVLCRWLGGRRGPFRNPNSSSPFARIALAIQSFGNLERREDPPLDLLAGFSGSFAGPAILSAGLIIVSFQKTFPRLLTGRIRITLEVSNGPSYNSCSMRRILKTANKPLEIKPQEKSVWICMCGLSKNQPYCDGSHKKVADEEDGKTYEYDSEGRRREVTS